MKMRVNMASISLGASVAVLGAAALALTSGYELRPVHAGIANAAVAGQVSAMNTAPPTTTVTNTGSADPAGSSLQNLYVNISDKMMPSVVNIFTTKKVRPQPRRAWPGFGGGGMSGDDLWNHFFGGRMGPGGPGFAPGAPGAGPDTGADEDDIQPQGFAAGPPSAPAAMPMSLGTGFIVETENGGGLILTNYHVIAGADEVKVKFTESADENEVSAQVLGKDPELDVALLRVKTDRPLKAVALGDSDKLKVGEWVAALGNPFGHGHSISHGIVSAKERSLPGGFGKYLQVDAPINPGNSGGPLVNLNAEVVGINNAIDARGTGIGFAIPANSIKAVLAQLKSGKQVERGYLGVNIMPLKPELARALRTDVAAGTPVVAEVVPGTPAAKAGVEPYDVITEVNGKKVKNTEELMQAIMQVQVGQKVKAEILRAGKHMTLEMSVSKRPNPQRA